MMPITRGNATIFRYGAPTRISADSDFLNADWTKQVWDLPFEYGTDEFLEWLKKQGMTLAEFKKLPAYRLGVLGG